MRTPFVYRLLVGLALLQIALFGLFGNGSYGDVLCARQVAALITGSRLRIGDRMPRFAAYAASGSRVNPLALPHSAAFIFYGCGCDSDRIRGWAEAAKARGEAVSIFTPNPPTQLDSRRLIHQLSMPMYAIRTSEIQTIIGLNTLPAAVHLSQDGTILGIQQ